MKVKAIPSAWIRLDGRRLDCGPYMSGALEAKIRLEEKSCQKDRLGQLTAGHAGGIYNGPQFSRNFVDSPEHGVPFLSTSSMLRADLSNLPLLRKKDAYSTKLAYLKVRPGMTLISCSGTIGRMVYARPDMDGMWSSQDILKVVPNSSKVPSGYLYAFLSSKYGVPLVTSGTYGAIIQHIEPQHIAGLPVPRLSPEVELRSHELVEKAGKLRVDASAALRRAVKATLAAWGVDDLVIDREAHPDIVIHPISQIRSTRRLDAFFYGRGGTGSDRVLANIKQRTAIKALGAVSTEVFETSRFGRRTVDDPAYGVPFLSISDLVKFDPRTAALVSKAQVKLLRADVKAGWLILPRVGQLEGVFGTVCYIPRHLEGVGVSDNNIRIIPRSEDEGAYLWAALSTSLLYFQIVRRACGTSIPYLDARRVREIPVPWPKESVREEIAAMVIASMEKRSLATEAEDGARALVERDIEEAV